MHVADVLFLALVAVKEGPPRSLLFATIAGEFAHVSRVGFDYDDMVPVLSKVSVNALVLFNPQLGAAPGCTGYVAPGGFRAEESASLSSFSLAEIDQWQGSWSME